MGRKLAAFAALAISAEIAWYILVPVGLIYPLTGDKLVTDKRFTVACVTGNTVLVRAFLALGADPHIRLLNKDIPIGLAVVGGHKDVVDLLISRGVPVDASMSRSGETPLMVALDCRN